MNRLLSVAALGAVIAALGVFAAVALGYQDDPTAHKVVICHATASVANPYRETDVDKDSIQSTEGLVANGHGTHVGPIFDPETNQNGDEWGDIIPPFAAGYLAGPPEKEWGAFPGLNWTEEGQAIWENGCEVPGAPEDREVVPLAPTFRDPTCDVGADVILPVVAGVEYTVEGKVEPGQKVEVTAEAEEGYVFPEGATTRWEHTFGNVPDNCAPPSPPAIKVTPGVTFQDPTCDVGAAVIPTTTTGLTYTIDGKVAPGETVTVTASARDGYTIIGVNTWEHTFGQVPDSCSPPPETTPTTPATEPTAPLAPPTATTTPARPATRPKVEPAAKPAPPKQAVAGADEQKKPTLAYTP